MNSSAARRPAEVQTAAAHPRPLSLHVTPAGQSAPASGSAGTRGSAPRAGGLRGGRQGGCESSATAEAPAAPREARAGLQEARAAAGTASSAPLLALSRLLRACLLGSREVTSGWKGDVGHPPRPNLAQSRLCFGLAASSKQSKILGESGQGYSKCFWILFV